MKIGTKSLLFGIHQVFWHPIMVYKAWVYLYGRPSFKETICIIIHDCGYFGKPNLDGPEGILHPELGAKIADKLFGSKYGVLCLCHSRGYIKYLFESPPIKCIRSVKLPFFIDYPLKIDDITPSKLCWADKLSFCFEPRWFYLLRARLSGELKLIRQYDHDNHVIYINKSDKEWFDQSVQNFKNIPELKILLSEKEKK